MTVCVVSLFRWNYGTRDRPNYGSAAIAAADRKITAGDVEYEPPQMKMASITQCALILISGDYALHSEAVLEASRQIKNDPKTKPENIALIYGRTLQAIKRRYAEDVILAPLGLNTDMFLGQQRDFSTDFVDRITTQLQDFKRDETEDEALVVGSDGVNVHLYHVDHNGSVSCLDDLGFAAIGSGAWHAKSRLMQVGYVNSVSFSPALAATFAAKKAAEIAPGVGTFTDLRIVTKDWHSPISDELDEKLPAIYDDYRAKRAALDAEAIQELQKWVDSLPIVPRPPDVNPASSADENLDEAEQPS